MKRFYRYHFFLVKNEEFSRFNIYVDAHNRSDARAIAAEFVACCFGREVSLCFAFRENVVGLPHTCGVLYFDVVG